MNRITVGAELSIGISAYGNAKVTRQCLDSLLDSAEGDFELILVDDCSPDHGETTELFRSVLPRHRNTRVFSFRRNLEYSGSLNCILSHATGDLVSFLSNDIFVTPSYLEELVAVANGDDRIGIVRGVSNFVDNGKSTHNLEISGQMKTLADLPQFAAKVQAARRGAVLLEDFLTGDAFLVKRRVIDAIGTFDPAFYGYFADHDYGVRARRAGFQLAVALGAFAYHQRAANFDYLPDAQRRQKVQTRWAKIHENWARFKLKYGLPVSQLYSGMAAIDWEQLNGTGTSSPQDLHFGPEDYSEYLLNPPS